MGEGLIGAVAKPISGGFDLVPKTVEGAKNTTNYFEKQTKEVNRIRRIRPFFTSHKLVFADKK